MNTSNRFLGKNRKITTLTWKGSRHFNTQKSKGKNHSNIVKVKYKDITNPATSRYHNITILLMHSPTFFLEIGPNLSKTIPHSIKPVKSSLKCIAFNTILLNPSREDEIHKLVSQVNKRKALGPLPISVTILKGNVNILSNPLNFIINPITTVWVVVVVVVVVVAEDI